MQVLAGTRQWASLVLVLFCAIQARAFRTVLPLTGGRTAISSCPRSSYLSDVVGTGMSSFLPALRPSLRAAQTKSSVTVMSASTELVAEKGDFVALSYTLTLDDGKVVDTTENKKDKLFETELGTGALLTKVEDAIVGLKPGDETKVSLEPADAFGPYSEELSFTLPKSQIGAQASMMEAGMKVQLGTGDVALISEVTEDAVTIDANHPLAGKALTFDIALHAISAKAADVATATVAGGCFWGLELAYQRVPGVLGTAVGYTQGEVDEPSYQEVCSGSTGHTEAVQVKYDPKVVSYAELLDVFFGRVNPTQLNRQGNDMGTQYRSGIYFHDEAQEKAARAAVEKAQGRFDDPIVTELLPTTKFWMAEDYHQQYLEKGGQDASKGAEETIRCYG